MIFRQFLEGPKITTRVKVCDQLIEHITLAPSASFTLQIEGHGHPSLIKRTTNWFEKYGQKRNAQRPAFDLTHLPPFYQKVLEALVHIPYGTFISYQELSNLAASPKASRAAGSACKNNPLPLIIPCHRVVHADRSLGNFLYGVEMKKHLIEFEGEMQQLQQTATAENKNFL